MLEKTVGRVSYLNDYSSVLSSSSSVALEELLDDLLEEKKDCYSLNASSNCLLCS